MTITNIASCSASRDLDQANPTSSATNSLHHLIPILQPQWTTSLSSAEHHSVENTRAFKRVLVSHDSQQCRQRSLSDIIDDALEVATACLNDDTFQ
mmetsp:Transcript_12200/g.17020  ORF Transcript_12200/g.17020 Transcript_12200/m.17020 type:complete len:96 (-) Transcript_12200:617-904(-)